MEPFSLVSTRAYPTHQYEMMKNTVLGKKYMLSLAFVTPKKAQELNVTYRKKKYIPNVLAFPLSEDTGEIYIALSVAQKEAKKFSMTYEGYVGYLFVHALLHLKGLDHGEPMEKEEVRLKKRFQLS
jgi:probable rRNA maturation factor